MEQVRKSGCFCGAVEVELSGAPNVQAYCHCSSCRGWLGAPIHAATLWPAQKVKGVKGADKKLKKAKVTGEIVRHGKGDKIVVFKMKRRKNYAKKQGHRQGFTEVKINDINLG